MLKLLVIFLLVCVFNSLDLEEGEEKMLTFTLDGGKKSKEFTILEIESDTLKIIIESLDNDYKVTMYCDEEEEECDWEYDGKKSILTYYSSKNNNRYFMFHFELTNTTHFQIYYYKATTVGQVFLIILYIILGIGALIVCFLLYKKIRKEAKIKEEKKQRLLAEKKEDESKIEQYVKLVLKNPSYINTICPICFKDKDGHNFPAADSIILDESDDIDIKVDTYKRKLIEGINNGSLGKLIRYIKVKNCEHFFHEKCKNSKKNKWYNTYHKHECLFCSNWISQNNLRAFATISERQIKTIIEAYHFKEHFPNWRYPVDLRKKFFKFIYECQEIPEEKRDEIKARRKLTIKFINDLFYENDWEIDINSYDLNYWENRYEEELREEEERKVKHQAKEREIQAKRDNIVDLTCCEECARTCCLCYKRDCVLEGSRAHKTCLLFPNMCLICRQKSKNIYPFVGFCFSCKSKYKVENKVHCAVCRQPLM